MADHGTPGANAKALPPHIVRHCGHGFTFWTSRNLQTHVARTPLTMVFAV